MNSIEIKNLTKIFKGSKEPALDNLSINIESSKIMGLVGPDGAGKTTLIRLIAGLLTPTEGEIKTLGLCPTNQRDLINEKIGYMPQRFGLYEDLSVIENLTLYSELKGIKPEEKEDIFEKLLSFTDLKRFQSRMAGALSGGMKQKLGLACALLGKPELLLLDEPSVGVDPISRQELMNMVKELATEGIAILWSTAYLDEAQNFDDCILLDEGKILYNGEPDELTKKLEGRVFLARDEQYNNRKLLKNVLKDGKGITDAVIQGDYVRVVLDEQIDGIGDVKIKLTPTKPRFEDAVIDILGGCPKGESNLAKHYDLMPHKREYVIEALDLVKKYGDFYAVKNNTFCIKKGEIFGLLGPNGAGKSTSFKMMCGLATPTAGTAKIMGQDILQNPSKARSYLGYMAQKFSLYGDLSVRDNLKFFSGVYGLGRSNRKEKIDEIVQIFNFERYLNSLAGELPLGYKQRLSLACAVMHDPPVLFLDEPTSGVDPLTRRDFWSHINALAEKGVTVMVTTHFMDEAEYCDRISLFYRGETIATGTPTKLKHKISPDATMQDAFIGLIKQYDERINV